MKRFRSLIFLGWPLLVVPQILLYTGFALNKIVMALNGGVMPVLWNSMNKWNPDETHVIMTPATHLKFLCDWINLGDATMSPGDVLICLSDTILIPFFWMWVGYILYRATRDEIHNPY